MTDTYILLQTIAMLCNNHGYFNPRACQKNLYACTIVKERAIGYLSYDVPLTECLGESDEQLNKYPAILAAILAEDKRNRK